MSKQKPALMQIVIVAAVVVVVIVVASSLMGPAIGNIFSNTTAALGGDGSVGYYAAPPASGEQAGDEGRVDALDGDFRRGLTTEQQAQERVILKSAALSLTVTDPALRLNEVALMAEEMGGWVVTSSTGYFTNSAGEQVARGYITIRVPAARLNEALERIKGGEGLEKINSESISGQDVTQQYVDLSSRLKNLEAAEQQLQTIMDSARKVDDVMTVYNQLVNVRGEIETIKGQLQYYQEAAAYSSIEIELLPPEPGPVQAQTTGWSPVQAAENALGALVSVVRTGIDVAVSVVVFAGPLAVGLWVLWMAVRVGRRMARRPQA